MSQESLLTKIPENTSFLQSTKFTFTFPTLPFLRYFSQTAQLPSVTTSPVQVPNPFSDMFRHGDKLVYDQFNITALVDEDIRTWEETYNWLKALTKPQDYNQYVRYYNSKGTPYHDAILTVNTNANVPNFRVLFKDCHPISLSALQFDSKINADNAITMDVTFRYDFYEIERL
jgi:hypothetical protein